ncbi:hypothetical protein LPJ70_001725 [Coemansia sp. RSA 2708]|nr:hypothetical protein LPJ70_001725 [Coemansia sp. RSA 2708]KAJ2310533.1 hypothetical protein IWW52_005385 [Coemansia sp. RSA 2704]KAJ2311739.1 hypothetical protein IWW54_002475 [Coemansia sp. RSA 2705]
METAGLRVPSVEALAQRFRVVLASASPRRRELVDRLGIEYEVVPSTFAEDLDKAQFATAGDYVLENAVRKAADVHQRVAGESTKPLFVIGSDTVVVDTGGRILEKPASDADAAATLRSLSGATNTVYTGVCLSIDVPGAAQPRLVTAIEKTEVVFGDMDDALVDAYVATGEPHDKAGSYAYQSLACFFVREIRGDYYNVVGFPCARFFRMLGELHSQGIL